MIKGNRITILFIAVLFCSYQYVYSAAPSIQLTVNGAGDNPTILTSPATYTVDWIVGNSPDECTASGSWSGDKSLPSGSDPFTKSAGGYEYNLACLGGTALPEGEMGIVGSAASPKDSPPASNTTASIYGLAVQGDYAFATIYDYITCSAGCSPGPSVIDDWDELAVYDVSDPKSPQLVARTWTGIQPNDILINGNYAYVISSVGINSGEDLGVYDISNPLTPTLVGAADFDHSGMALGIQGQYLYVVGGNAGQDMSIYSIADPVNPVRVGGYDFGTSIGTGYGSDIVLKGDYAYVAVDYIGGISARRLETFNISNPGFPSRVDIDTRFGHQFTRPMEISGDYIYMVSGDALIEAFSIIETFNEEALSMMGGENPVYVGSIDLSAQLSPGTSIRSMKVSTSNSNYMYVGTGSAGVVTLDVSDPANMSIVTSLPHSNLGKSLAFYGNYILEGRIFPTSGELSVLAAKSTSSISVTVQEPAPASAVIVADDCVIADGESTCDIAITWDGVNTEPPNRISRDDTIIAEGVPEISSMVDDARSEGSYTYYFYDSSGSLASDDARAACASGSSINDSSVCAVTPQNPLVTVQAEGLVRRNQTTTVVINIDSESLLNCEVYGATDGSPNSFIHHGPDYTEQQYEYVTKSLSSAQVVEVRCSVDGFSSVVGTDDIRIDVVPDFQEL